MKRQLALLAAAAVIATAGAATLSPEQALQRARGNAPARAKAFDASQMRLVHTATTAKGEAAAYVFTREEGAGFSILSASDLALPVLGYSDSGSLEAGSMPQALRWWLSQYAAQIEYAESTGMPVYENTRHKAPEAMTAIEPLVKTKWDQGAPFSDQCPKSGVYTCPTGCVATSMAQVMNYFKYPEQAQGSVQYRWGNRSLFLNFEEQPFAWDKMLDVYADGDYTEEQGAAVAYLMKACGYSVEMDYQPSMSGAVSSKIINAMKTYFKYDSGVRYVSRDIYSYDEWVTMCYDNLRNCGPIIYNGTDPIAGGHSFIVDGYDGNGYFHLNWGWSGMSDGYFSLDALTPVTQGTGGAMGGFNYSQDAVLGLKIPDGTPSAEAPLALYQYGSSRATISGRKISFSTTGHYYSGWANLNTENMAFTFGFIVEPENGGDRTVVPAKFGSSIGAQKLQPYQILGIGFGLPNAELPDLTDGTYKVTIATRLQGADSDAWVPVDVAYGYPNYCLVNVSDGAYSVENQEARLLKFETVELTSPLYRNRNTRLKAHISNPYDIQLTACITPQLVKNGTLQYAAETILVTVDPGQTIDYEWVAKFYESSDADPFVDPASYTLKIYNQDTRDYYGEYGTVEMTTTSNGFTLKMDELLIEDAEKGDVSIGGNDYKNVYVVKDPSDFTVDFGYHVSKGYFDTTITLGIFRKNTTGATYIPVTDYIWESTPFLGTDESESVKVPVSFAAADPETVYYLRAEYVRNGSPIYFGQISFNMPNSTDIEQIVEDETTLPVEYFNMQGIRVMNPEKGQLLIKRQGTRSEKVIF